MAAEVIRLGARRRGAWRVAVGRVLRGWRTEQGLRLADVAAAAGVSTQYLSEVERGRKEPSSEVLGAVTDALGSSLTELALGVADGLREAPARRRELHAVGLPELPAGGRAVGTADLRREAATQSRELRSVGARHERPRADGAVTLLAA